LDPAAQKAEAKFLAVALVGSQALPSASSANRFRVDDQIESLCQQHPLSLLLCEAGSIFGARFEFVMTQPVNAPGFRDARPELRLLIRALCAPRWKAGAEPSAQKRSGNLTASQVKRELCVVHLLKYSFRLAPQPEFNAQ
jgi:hypothetical protein